jgi:hypothetical protein
LLGAWDTAEVIRISPRHGYSSPSEKLVYIPVNKNKYHSHQTFDIKRTSGRYHPNRIKAEATNLPLDAIPADFYEYPESIFFEFALPTPQTTNIAPNEDQQWSAELLQHLIIEDLQQLQTAIEDKESELNIVSDGGVHDYNSNFGMVIALKSMTLATNKGKIYSITFHESSYRSEMFRLLASIVSLHYIIKTYHMTVSTNKILNFYCDKKSVIKLVNARQELQRKVNQFRYPDVDIEVQLLHEIQHLHNMNFITRFEHVKGHQDTKKRTALTTIEALNVEADELTHAARKLSNIKEYHKFPTNKVNLSINHQYINSHYPKMVNLAFHSMALREYYVTKHCWTSKTINSLWWSIYFQSPAKLPDSDKLRIQKFVNNRWPTLYRSQKYNKKATQKG